MRVFDFLDRKKSFGASNRRQVKKPVEQAAEIEKAIKLIQKNPLMKYTYDSELLDAIRSAQEQLIVNQELIIDSVTVKDPNKGEIGLSDYLVSGSLLKDIKQAKKEREENPPSEASEQVEANLSEESTQMISNQITDLKNVVSNLEESIQQSKSIQPEQITSSEGITELREELREFKSLLVEKSEKIVEREVVPKGFEEKDQQILDLKTEINKLKEHLKQKEEIGKLKPFATPLEEDKITKPKPKKKVIEPKEVVVPKKVSEKRSFGERIAISLGSGLKHFSSLFGHAELLKKTARFETFVEGNFSFKYPKWPPDINVSEDVVLSVSSGPFGVELSAKEIFTLTFGAYVNKIITLIKSQLKANILVQTIGVDTAYLEFVFKQGNLYWLYKAKIIECNGKFYTIAVKGLKSEISKIEEVSQEVLNSIRCET